MNVLDLFSGIGGFSLGLERAGMRTVAFCEIEPYCRAVLAKRWPGVPCYGDIRELTAARLDADGIAVDVICGGFPCQDISFAGKGAGLAGARSGLWGEYRRLISELEPRWVVVENVSALLSRGLGDVLGNLAKIGYDAEWHCIPAAYVGAPHRRDRIWIVAYPSRDVRAERQTCGAERERTGASCESVDAADAKRDELREQSGRLGGADGPGSAEFANDGKERALANAEADGRSERSGWDAQAHSGEGRERQSDVEQSGSDVDDSDGKGLAQREACSWEAGTENGRPPRDESAISGQWIVEPDVGRVAHGVPSRVDRLRALGNAVVPQIPEIIGRAIMKASAANQEP